MISVVVLHMLMTNGLIRMECHHSMGDSVFCVGNGGGVEGIDACWGTIVSLANGLSRMECQQYDDAPDCQ